MIQEGLMLFFVEILIVETGQFSGRRFNTFLVELIMVDQVSLIRKEDIIGELGKEFT